MRYNNLRAYTKLLALTIIITSSSLGKAFLVDISGFGITTQSGHEELTRQSLSTLSNHLKATNSSVFVKDGTTAIPAYHDLISKAAESNITIGNYATDFPKGRYPVNIIEYWGLPSNITPLIDHRTSVWHSTRNATDATHHELMSAYATCELVRENLTRVTTSILEHWLKQEKIKAYFMMGHALHTIQDSFAGAHVKRETSNLYHYHPIDFCHYTGKKEPSRTACLDESTHLHRDNIWLANVAAEVEKTKTQWLPHGETVEPLPGVSTHNEIAEYDINNITEAERANYLTHEARLAKVASIRFLLLVTSLLEQIDQQNKLPDTATIQSLLKQKLFEGHMNTAYEKHIMNEGILNCKKLNP